MGVLDRRGGGTTSFGVVLARELEDFAILKGAGGQGAKSSHPLKGGVCVQNVLPCFEGTQKVL